MKIRISNFHSDYCSDYGIHGSERRNFRSGTKEKIEIAFCVIPATGVPQAFLALQEKRKHRILVPKRSLQGEPRPQCRLWAEDQRLNCGTSQKRTSAQPFAPRRGARCADVCGFMGRPRIRGGLYHTNATPAHRGGVKKTEQ